MSDNESLWWQGFIGITAGGFLFSEMIVVVVMWFVPTWDPAVIREAIGPYVVGCATLLIVCWFPRVMERREAERYEYERREQEWKKISQSS